MIASYWHVMYLCGLFLVTLAWLLECRKSRILSKYLAAMTYALFAQTIQTQPEPTENDAAKTSN